MCWTSAKRPWPTKAANTFVAVAGEFLTKYRGRQNRKPAPRTLAEIKRVLDSDLFADWGARPMAKVTKRNVMDVLDVLVERDAEVMANRTLAYLSMLFGWALHREIIAFEHIVQLSAPVLAILEARKAVQRTMGM